MLRRRTEVAYLGLNPPGGLIQLIWLVVSLAGQTLTQSQTGTSKTQNLTESSWNIAKIIIVVGDRVSCNLLANLLFRMSSSPSVTPWPEKNFLPTQRPSKH